MAAAVQRPWNLRCGARCAEPADSVELDAAKAEVLLHARDPDLEAHCAASSPVRDAGMLEAGPAGGPLGAHPQSDVLGTLTNRIAVL